MWKRGGGSSGKTDRCFDEDRVVNSHLCTSDPNMLQHV